MKQLVFAGLMFAMTAWATDIITRDGTTYRDCTISKVDPNGISILYTNGPVGGAKIKFIDLPEEIQKKYNYDAVKAAEFEKEEQAQRLREAEAEKEALRLAKLKPKHSQTNQVATTNATNNVTQAKQPKQPKTQVQNHPQRNTRPRVIVVRPPAIHAPAQKHSPVQHHPPAHGKTQSASAKQDNEIPAIKNLPTETRVCSLTQTPRNGALYSASGLSS